MTSFGHSKPCPKTMHIYASLTLISSLIKLMRVNYTYNNKKNLTWIFMKGAGCYINGFRGNIVDSITLLTMRIANKNSWSSSFIELMFDVHVFSKTQANKRTKRRINRDGSNKDLMR